MRWNVSKVGVLIYMTSTSTSLHITKLYDMIWDMGYGIWDMGYGICDYPECCVLTFLTSCACACACACVSVIYIYTLDRKGREGGKLVSISISKSSDFLWLSFWQSSPFSRLVSSPLFSSPPPALNSIRAHHHHHHEKEKEKKSPGEEVFPSSWFVCMDMYMYRTLSWL